MSRALLACVLAAAPAAVAGDVAATVMGDSSVPPDVVARLARLDCSRIGAADVREVLARVPAPRIVLLQGSVPLVTMEPFAQFLIAMGYPEARLADPRDGTHSYNSFADGASLAGALAFDYEQTGLAPMLIGHSQGGALAIRVLHELAGAFHDTLHVVDPATGATLARTTIVDPYTHDTRPVVGLRVAYAAAIATGWLPRVLLGQWTMLSRLRTIPDTVSEFTGFDVPNDPIAGNLLGISPYRATGGAQVRSVVLPAGYGHISAPRTAHLAADPRIRAYVESWTEGSTARPPDGDTENLVHAADIWHSVKRHWCLQARRLLVHPAS
ncbi:MAG TPA: hypothetical protein VJV77_12440 [Casimicrobiaceae bacterium]|nr:hypothetical protein [Casimicrobiaceae bacterium]